LSSLTDIHGKKIMEKLMKIYSDPIQNLDNRLRIGEAILQTIQRCGDVLGKYILNKDQNKILRISALSIIGFACETSPLALTTWFRDIVDWILNILDIQKDVEIRRDLLERSWRTLKYVEEIDNDDLIKYHARVGISILETISQNELMGINN
ncbi:20676_t:CDS:2, partial [Dentiscutata erythropus]